MSTTQAVCGGALIILLIVCGAQPSQAAPVISFGAPATYRASAFSTSSVYGAGQIASGDVDGDRDRDLVVSDCNGGGPLVFLNHGNGSFGAARQVNVGSDACVVASGDLNRDGLDDIVTGSVHRNDAAVLLAAGDGNFHGQVRYGLSGGPVMQLALADFDSDRRIDVAALTNSPGTVTVLAGLGDGSFTPRPPMVVATLAMSFTVGDVDGDSRPDLAVGDAAGRAGLLQSDVVVARNRGDGGFDVTGLFSVGSSPEGMASADLDGDGNLDVVAANANTSDLSLLWGRGNGTFEPEHRLPGACPICGKPGVKIADFNRDGLLDIASTATVSGRVEVHAGVGGRFFARAGSVLTTGPLPTMGAIGPQMFVADDLDGNGSSDLAVAGYLPSLDLADVLAGRPLVTRVAVLLNNR